MNPPKQPESRTHPDNPGVNNALDSSINLQDFLLEDYKHGSAFIMQILQDITAALNLYFLLLAIFVSGLGVAYQSNLITKPILTPVLVAFLFAFGIIHFFFFVRFISFGFVYHETVERINGIREFYVQQFQTQIPAIKNVLSSYSSSNSFYTVFLPINTLLAFLLALTASLCFAGAAFLLSELVFNINGGKLFPFPADIRLYCIGLFVGVAVFLLQRFYYQRIQKIAKTLKTQLTPEN